TAVAARQTAAQRIRHHRPGRLVGCTVVPPTPADLLYSTGCPAPPGPCATINPLRTPRVPWRREQAGAVNRRFHNLVWITVVLALLAAVPASARWAEEAANTTVEIVIDHHEAARSAARLGEDPTRLLARAQEAGAVSAAVREVTLLRLRDQERLILIDGSQASAVLEALAPILPGGPGGGAAVRPGWTYAVLEDGDLARWLLEAWTTYSRAGIIAGEPALHAGQGRYVLAVPEQTPRARVLPLGFSPGDLQRVQAAGLDVIPVVYEPPLRTARMLDLALERWRRLPPARWVLIEQDPAPGFPGVDYPERYADVGAVIRSLEAEVGLLE